MKEPPKLAWPGTVGRAEQTVRHRQTYTHYLSAVDAFAARQWDVLGNPSLAAIVTCLSRSKQLESVCL